MLPDRITQLLTAYVDGELGSKQRQEVERLVEQSIEARAFLKQLERDAEGLRQLPQKTVGRDLAPQVLAAIAGRRVLPARREPAARLPAYPAYLGLATAAAVLLVIGASSYLYFSVAHPAGDDPLQLAGNEEPREPELIPGPSVLVEADQQPTTSVESTAVAQSAPPGAPDKTPEPAGPETNPEEILTGRANQKEKHFLEVPDAKLAFVLPSVRDLEQEKKHQLLRDKLQKDQAYSLELRCKETYKAFERLESAFRNQGVGFLVEQEARKRLNLRLRGWPNYVLYVENLTPDEVAAILRRLGVEDKNRRGDGQFSGLILNRMSAEDHHRLTGLMGVNPMEFPPPSARTPLGVDLSRPLSELTADQVVRALKGPGTRPEAGKSAVKPLDRQAIVMAYDPGKSQPNPSKDSREVKDFLSARKEARPGTVRMILVLSGSNG